MRDLGCTSLRELSRVPEAPVFKKVALRAFAYSNSGDNDDFISYQKMLFAVELLDELRLTNQLGRSRKFIEYCINFHAGGKIDLSHYKWMLFYDLLYDDSLSSQDFIKLLRERNYRSKERKRTQFMEFWNEGKSMILLIWSMFLVFKENLKNLFSVVLIAML